MNNTPIAYRRYDLDWLRVIAFGLLIFYHAGMAYVPQWEWYIKDENTNPYFEYWMLFLNRWRMPLLFSISGAGVWFSLRRRTALHFMEERTLRLLLPLLFGMLFIIPPQIYLERLLNGGLHQNYWQFQWSVFHFEAYPAGNFGWHHLWYLPYIFAFSIVCLPFFLYWRSERATPTRDKLNTFVARYPIVLFLLFLLLGLSDELLEPYFPVTHDLLHDWANFSASLIFFVSGFVLASHEGFILTIRQNLKRWLGILLGLVALAVPILIAHAYGYHVLNWLYQAEFFKALLRRFLNDAFVWAWILSLMSLAHRYLNFKSKYLAYANQAIFPFYILHQTITVFLVYFMLQWHVSTVLKFSIIVVGTFGTCFVLYEFVIRKVRWLYPLFGLKWQPKQAAAAQASQENTYAGAGNSGMA